MHSNHSLPLDVEFGNAAQAETRGTGWFIGFSEWARSGGANLRYLPEDAASTGLCVKWYDHPAGHPNGDAKPVSVGRTISILVSPVGEFRIECSPDPAFPPQATVVHVLRRAGDFVIWGEGIHHRTYGLQPSSILSIRWTPQPGGSN